MYRRKLYRIFAAVIAVILCLVCLAGCGSKSAEKPKKKETSTTAASENTSQETSKYKYLVKTVINSSDGSTKADAYVPGDPETSTEDNPSSGEVSGISVEDEITQSDVSKAVVDKANSVNSELKDSGYKKIKMSNLQKTSDKALCSLSYSVVSGKKEYPCRSVILGKSVGGSYALTSVITIDNTMSDEKSAAVLGEVFEAYGLTSSSDAADQTEKTESTKSAEKSQKEKKSSGTSSESAENKENKSSEKSSSGSSEKAPENSSSSSSKSKSGKTGKTEKSETSESSDTSDSSDDGETFRFRDRTSSEESIDNDV